MLYPSYSTGRGSSVVEGRLGRARKTSSSEPDTTLLCFAGLLVAVKKNNKAVAQVVGLSFEVNNGKNGILPAGFPGQ